ncbi:hypothetical protein PENTCL1PPCAC_15424, partial [Pristionchus entomophagus]
QGSEYVPSEESGGDTEESDSEETSENGKRERKYRIVGNEQLLELFRRCKECGAQLDTSEVVMREEGSACIVDYACLSCGKSVTWRSQSRIGKGKSTVYEGNQEIAVGAFITGVPIPRFTDFAQLLGLGLPTERAMRRTIRDIACPAIKRVFKVWEAHVRSMVKDVAEPGGIAVSIDGQYDSPGFNANNCKVTIMDANLKVAIAGVSLHKHEPEIGGVSIRMESTGALRALVELIDDGIPIKTRVTDRNRMVDKKLREHAKAKSIVAETDWWHGQKNLKKIWWQAMKNSPILTQLYCPFFNHLY